MRTPATLKRAAVAAAASILMTGAAGCAGSHASPAPAGGGTNGSTAGGGTVGGQVPSSAPETAPAAALSACALLIRADVMAVAATFPKDTITIAGHLHSDAPPTNKCAFNQKGVYTGNGMTMTLSGDHWAQLTVVANGSSYAFRPGGNDRISGLGDGAYWSPGDHTVVIRKGNDVLQVSDEVPVNPSASPDLVAAYRQAAQALAAKILSHV
jgi:hypothetical protein